jgi:hypothetical protein
MSNSTHDRAPPSTADRSSVHAALLTGPLAAVGFWSGIALPFLYVPLLLVGPQGGAEQSIAFALIAVHAVALFVGHSHRQDGATDR